MTIDSWEDSFLGDFFFEAPFLIPSNLSRWQILTKVLPSLLAISLAHLLYLPCTEVRVKAELSVRDAYARFCGKVS